MASRSAWIVTRPVACAVCARRRRCPDPAPANDASFRRPPAAGESALDVRASLAVSVGLADPGERPSLDELLARFDPDALPSEPSVLTA